jgi:hypothetical protein
MAFPVHICTFANEGFAVDPQQASAELKQGRMKEFMSLLPLTIELAGLTKAEPGRPFTPDQIEGRAMSLRAAFKIAKAMVRDIGDNGA